MTQAQLNEVKKFAKKAYAKTLDPQHDFVHVDRVAKKAIKIVEILKLGREIDVNLLQAACYLHDLAFIKHKPGFVTWLRETRYLKDILPGILKQFRLAETDRYILSEAVYRHTWAFPFRFLNRKYSLYAQIVQDADMLDSINKARVLGLNESKKLYRFYRFLTLFSGLFVKRMKKKMASYLNLPQILEYLKEE